MARRKAVRRAVKIAAIATVTAAVAGGGILAYRAIRRKRAIRTLDAQYHGVISGASGKKGMKRGGTPEEQAARKAARLARKLPRQRAYRKSEAGKAVQARYLKTEKGRTARSAASRRHYAKQGEHIRTVAAKYRAAHPGKASAWRGAHPGYDSARYRSRKAARISAMRALISKRRKR